MISDDLVACRTAVARAALNLRRHPADPAAQRDLDAARDRLLTAKLLAQLNGAALSDASRRRLTVALNLPAVA